jgi:hypothetical protein
MISWVERSIYCWAVHLQMTLQKDVDIHCEDNNLTNTNDHIWKAVNDAVTTWNRLAVIWEHEDTPILNFIDMINSLKSSKVF